MKKRTAADTNLAHQPRTIAKGGGRSWIHAIRPKGYWQRLRHISTVVLLALFYATPWLTVGGHPFIKLSFLSPSFVLFGNYILQQELYRFVVLALLLVVSLFMASALIGRAWCGYACPQTIFIEQVLGRIETWIEGPPARRLVQEKKPMTRNLLLRKIVKHTLFLFVCMSFAFTLVALFTGPGLILSGNSAAWWAIAILTLIAWFDGGYWREQFCHIACPYARFQSVMQDMQTRTIGYDGQRGEPRGRSRPSLEDQVNGDCIDCGLCVRVCPSGIDIRQGAAQLECTACARCIDACDSVMTSLHKPQGLIRYDHLGAFEAKPLPKKPFVRLRVIIYASMWLALFSIGIWQFVDRDLHHVRLLNVKGTLPYFQEQNRVKNLLSLKIGNQAAFPDVFQIIVRADGAAQGVRLESPASLGPIEPGQELVMPALISAERSMVGRYVSLEIKSEGTGKVQSVRKLVAGPTE